MTTMSFSSLRRDSLILIIAEYGSKVLLLATGFLMAHQLPTAEFGRFAASIALIQVLLIIIDAGMGQVVARDIAAGNASDRLLYVQKVFTWRLMVSVALGALMPLIARLFLPSTDAVSIAIWLVPSFLLMSLVDFVGWVLRGLQRMMLCGFIMFVMRGALLAGCAIALSTAEQSRGLLIAYGVSGLVGMLASALALRKVLGPLAIRGLDMTFYRTIIPQIYAFGAILIICVVSGRLDLLIVGKYAGETQAGIYGSVCYVMDALRILPFAVYGVSIPVFSAMADQKERLRRVFFPSFIVLLAMSLVLAVVGATFSETMFVRVFGESYAAAAHYFQPILWSGILVFVDHLIFAFLLAQKNLKRLALSTLVGLFVLLSVGLVFIHYWGPMGMAWARLISVVSIFVIDVNTLLKYQIISFNEAVLKPALIVGFTLLTLAFLPLEAGLLRVAAGLATCAVSLLAFFPVHGWFPDRKAAS